MARTISSKMTYCVHSTVLRRTQYRPARTVRPQAAGAPLARCGWLHLLLRDTATCSLHPPFCQPTTASTHMHLRRYTSKDGLLLHAMAAEILTEFLHGRLRPNAASFGLRAHLDATCISLDNFQSLPARVTRPMLSSDPEPQTNALRCTEPSSRKKCPTYDLSILPMTTRAARRAPSP